MDAINRTAPSELTDVEEPAMPARSAQTVVGLFDDPIDAEHALSEIHKLVQPAASVSVLARDRRADEAAADDPVDVTRAAMDTALSAVAGWLSGLAALMIPNQGHFLAAGPIGVVLARIRPDQELENTDPFAVKSAQPSGSVGLALERFGFRPEEARYLEQRLAAGSTLIAVTAHEQPEFRAALRVFSDQNAVFIGQAETPADVLAEASLGLQAPMSANAADIIIADIVAPFRNVCYGAGIESDLTQLCGTDVFDENGAQLGAVDDILISADADAVVRYLIVGQGGVLGIARRRYAVPAAIVRLGERPLRVTVGGRRVGELDGYDPNEPFSRKSESSICRFFDIDPYWES